MTFGAIVLALLHSFHLWFNWLLIKYFSQNIGKRSTRQKVLRLRYFVFSWVSYNSFFALSKINILISLCSHLKLVTAKIWVNHSIKMLKIIVLLLAFQIFIVKSSNNSCLKSYKKKLCIRQSIRNYDLCLLKQFNVFEENNKFCLSNTKCVPKTHSCSGFHCITLEIKLQ